MNYLILSKGGTPLLRYPITKEKLTIGRDPENDLVLSDEDISRIHLELVRENGHFMAKDLSTNGIYINDKKIEKAKVSKKDKIKIGTWTITFSDKPLAHAEPTVVNAPEATKIIAFDPKKKELTREVIELIVNKPNGKKTIKKFKTDRVIIGMDPSCDLTVDDDYISKKHCKIFFENGNLFLADLGSTNGTYFESERINKISLKDSTKFKVGETTIFVRLIEERERLKASKEEKLGEMIGASKQMKELFTLLKKVAPTDATICITGKSGTGKELVAHSLHTLSTRKDKPFVAINCGAIPASIIESELFGHEKGAFTGAIGQRLGVFEQANGGTLFLDEIGEMPTDLQTRLLRVLEAKTIRRIGGTRDVPVDVRIVAATNQNLHRNVQEGKFREDLFFRLFVIHIEIPTLSERIEDIEILAKYFSTVFNVDGQPSTFTGKAIKKLKMYNWPGNIRELKNTIQRAVIMVGEGNITPSDIVLTNLVTEENKTSLQLDDQEIQSITNALRRCEGNQSQAAKILGVARTTLANKIKRFNIDIPQT